MARLAPWSATTEARNPRLLWVVGATVLVLGVAAGCAYHVASVFFGRRVVAGSRPGKVVVGPLAQRVLVLVVDGLRYDVALESDRLPIARELAATGASGLVLADDPTMTGAGVRALGTAQPPSFSDIISNKRMPRVNGDHLFATLAAAGHTIAVVGDHTWVDLFGESVTIDETRSGVAPLIERLRPAYAQDQVFFEKALRVLRAQRSTVTVVHLSGADAISHGLGPHSGSYTKKLRTLDGQLRQLIAACGPQCTVVLTSDHGASDAGNHGIGEAVARRTPLVLHGEGVRHGVRFEARQADVAPTLATLLGAPVPGSMRGRVIVDALLLSQSVAKDVVFADAERLVAYAARHARAFGVALPVWDLAPARSRDLTIARSEANRIVESVLDHLRSDDGRRTHWMLAWIAVLAACAVLITALAIPHGTPVARRRIAYAVAMLVVVEVAFAAWRTNATWLRRELLEWHGVAAAPIYELAGAALLVLVGGVSRRWWRRVDDGRVLALLLVVASAALTDTALFAGALAGLVGLTLHLRERPALLVAVAAIVVLAASLVVAPWSRLPAPLLIVASWCAAGALVWWRHPPLDRVAVGLLVTLWLVAPIVQLVHSPLPARITVVAIIVSWIAVRRAWFVAWSGSALLLLLSNPAQLPGIVSVLAVVVATLHAGVRRPLALALAFVAARFALLRVLEGQLSYSAIEWHVGRLGGAPTKLVGHVLIAVKLALPVLVLVALAVATVGYVAARRAIAWTLAWALLAMAHATASLALTAGQYHTPYVDLSTLLFVAVVAGSLSLAWLALHAMKSREEPAFLKREPGRGSPRRSNLEPSSQARLDSADTSVHWLARANRRGRVGLVQ
jgi:hypothetical protein